MSVSAAGRNASLLTIEISIELNGSMLDQGQRAYLGKLGTLRHYCAVKILEYNSVSQSLNLSKRNCYEKYCIDHPKGTHRRLQRTA